MAKKTVKTKAKAKPKTKVKAKPQAVKAVVKKEPVAKVINKPLPSKTANKAKAGKILLIVGAALAFVAFFTLFAPAFNIDYKIGRDIVGVGTLSTFFTALLRIKNGSTITFVPVNDGGEVRIATGRGLSKGAMPYVTFSFMAILTVLALAILVLILLKKYKGKVKLIMSIVTWTFLVGAVALSFLSSVLLEVNVNPIKEPELFNGINTSLGLAPILYGTFGSVGLVSSITGFFLNRE